MKLIATIALAFALSAGMASASPCKLDGKNWKCPVGNTTYTIANANSAAEAAAFAAAHANQSQGQTQGQNQSSSNDNTNANSSSVNIEGAPKHTTSLGANIGLNVSLPVASGIQGASCRDTVRLAREMGQETLALNIFLECPHVRKLNLKVNPGDKG